MFNVTSGTIASISMMKCELWMFVSMTLAKCVKVINQCCCFHRQVERHQWPRCLIIDCTY